ncbi:hypothetical protein V6R85_01485 [Agrobacterium sp. CCNWLW32]|uniref:hypothetical protein n=1 Tax=Agrobacterium sp. CCNWLW32 TaxID=3122072 RepID=UPI0030100C79
MGIAEGVPVLGPYIKSGIQKASAGIASLIDGESYGSNLRQGEAITDEAQRAHPYINTAGQVAGAVGSMIPLGATSVGARALGMTGPSLMGRIGMSGLSNGVIGAADTAARGGDAKDIINNALIGWGVGAAIPAVGAGIKAGIQAIGDRVAPTVGALTSPDTEALRRVGVALSRDAAANPGQMVSALDEAAARASGVPLVNADRGGEVTRALTRSVANQSPEARGVIEKVASDRFGTQSQRAVNFIKRVAGGNVDDLAYQENLTRLARATNRPAYAAAEAAPEAQSMFSPRMQELMQSPTFRKAVDQVPRRSADRGAVEGFKEIGNPFSRNSQGAYVLKQKADGSLVSPSLKFWDQVQRNLRSDMDKAYRAGDKQTGSEIKALRDALLGDMDASVPAFKAARTGAASFFGAEDALDAGRSFANQPRSIPEAKAAFAKFSTAEKDAFSTGYASELIDKIKASPDRSNVINSMFKNQASRESIELALGPQKARQIEAYVRVEDLADRLRGSLGNSTTARQLVELGIGAGVGGGAGYGLTGDWKGAALGAVAPKAIQYVGAKADTQVMQSMAKLLTQDNPAALQVAIQQAAKTPAYMDALEKLSLALGAPARGAALAIGNQ